MRSLLLRCMVTTAAAASGGYLAAGAAPDARTLRIPITAQKYEFSATEIRIKKGQAVTVVLTTPDFVHGFSVPDFGVRADLVPGKTVEVTFTPDKPGRFVFLCDNFCGEAHDRMTGFLVVTDP
jgi:cytochrome c oxidase subunit II